jgi:hypothetical protein
MHNAQTKEPTMRKRNSNRPFYAISLFLQGQMTDQDRRLLGVLLF